MNFRIPIGTFILNKLASSFNVNKQNFYKGSILLFTFLCYFAYHSSRRPLSVVKSVLHHDHCPNKTSNDSSNNSSSFDSWCDWQPFDGADAKSLLSILDLSFLITYAIFMFVSGYVAERCNLRYFLTIGMILSGLLNYLFGLAYWLNIHSLYYFIIVQIISGILNTTGWPAVVAVVGNWFGKSKRGLIFGIWNSHTSLGNIAGAAIAGYYVEKNWGLSFVVPGLIIFGFGIIIFIFLTPSPEDIGLPSPNKENQNENKPNNLESQSEAISLWGAIKIPGVLEFSICLFFAKLVSYTFLYWLPLYINASSNSSPQESAFLAISFDIGGIVGGILAGYVADRTGASASTCILMLLLAIPSLLLYLFFGTVSHVWNEILQFIAGIFVNGPYALITTAVAAELGTKIKSKSALATVSAIIDGTGSIGAAVGPFLSGIVAGYGWNYVFYMVVTADLLALLSLLRISFNDIKRIRNKINQRFDSGSSTDNLYVNRL